MRGHTCGFMTMVIGGAYVQSIKQKLNTNSSTEVLIVGVDYILTQVVWTQYLLKEQGLVFGPQGSAPKHGFGTIFGGLKSPLRNFRELKI